MDSLTLPEIRVQAAHGMKLGSVGKNVDIIDSEQIHRLGLSSVDAVLRAFTGIEVISRGVNGAQNDISIRGSSFNQVLVLVDGIRMNDPLTGHFSMYTLAQTIEIDRIEVINGASSTLYGTEALGGVINIITKKHADKVNAALITQVGQHGLKQFQGALQIPISDRFSAQAMLALNDTHGYMYRDSMRRDLSFSTHSIGLNYFHNDWEINLRHAYDDRDFNAQFFYTQSTFDLSREYITRLQESVLVKKNIGNILSIELNGSYIHTTDSFVFNPAFTPNTHTTNQLELNTRATYFINPTHEFVSGISLLRQSIISSDRGDHDLTRYSAFGLLSSRLTERLNSMIGLRIDRDPFIKTQWTPELSVTYQWTDQHRTRSSISRGIRGGDFTERYVGNLLPRPISPGRNVGNPFLQAESNYSVEIGHDWRASSRLEMGITGFYRKGNNLIDFALTPGNEIFDASLVIDTAEYFYTRNIRSLDSYGAELSLAYNHELNAYSSLRGQFALTLIHHSSADGIVSKYVTGRATMIGSANIHYNRTRWDIGISGNYKRRDSESNEGIGATLESHYTLLNLNTGIYIIPKKLRIGLQVQNILNSEFSDVLGAELSPRWFIGEIGYDF